MLYRKYPKAITISQIPITLDHYSSRVFYREDVGWHVDNVGYLVVVITNAKAAKFKISTESKDIENGLFVPRKPVTTVSLSTGDIIVFDTHRMHSCEGCIEFRAYCSNNSIADYTEIEANNIAKAIIELTKHT